MGEPTVDCGAGWEWNEALGRCVSNDPQTASPSMEFPAVLEDWIRQAANFVGGNATTAGQWVSGRSRTLAEMLWNTVLALGQNGVTVADLPGVGEVQLLPGHLGEGMPFTIGGIPFRVKITPSPEYSPPNGVWNSTQVTEDQVDAIVAALYQKVGDNTVPTPLLRTVADLLMVTGHKFFVQNTIADWPPYRLGNEVHNSVEEVHVRPEFVELMPEGFEFEGQRLLKGEVLTAWALYASQHLQLRVPTVGAETPQWHPILPLLVAMITASSDRFTFYEQD